MGSITSRKSITNKNCVISKCSTQKMNLKALIFSYYNLFLFINLITKCWARFRTILGNLLKVNQKIFRYIKMIREWVVVGPILEHIRKLMWQLDWPFTMRLDYGHLDPTPQNSWSQVENILFNLWSISNRLVNYLGRSCNINNQSNPKPQCFSNVI